jgi:hypothetical protein
VLLLLITLISITQIVMLQVVVQPYLLVTSTVNVYTPALEGANSGD